MTLFLKHFDELSTLELYTLMRLRQEIFIVEQDCPYVDADGVDLQSHHVLMMMEGMVKAGARIIPPEVQYHDFASIGRVIVRRDARGTGLGRKVMLYAIRECRRMYPGVPIKISAQSYLRAFYESVGFRATEDAYLEDDIPHLAMILD